MKEVTAQTVVPASCMDVFSVIPDPDGPFFLKNRFACTSILGNQSTGIGTIYRWDFRLPLGINFIFDEIVTHWDEPKRFTYQSISRPDVLTEIILEQKPEGTLVIFTIKYNIKGFFRFFVPSWLVRIGIKKGLVNIHNSVKLKARAATTLI